MASVAVSFREGPCPLSSCLGEAQSPAHLADPKGQIQDPPSLLQLWPTFRGTALRMGITDLESWPGVEPTLSSPVCSWGLQSSPGQRALGSLWMPSLADQVCRGCGPWHQVGLGGCVSRW